jgi:predicted deacylase
LAHLFIREIAARCDFGIDLHTGSNFRTNLPQIRAFLEDPQTLDLAKSFGPPVIVPSQLREGSLREAVAELGKPVLVYEAGEALYFNESAIRTGVRGIVKLMRHTGMLSSNRKDPVNEPIITHKTSWVRAGMSGTFTRNAKLGALVKRGALLGMLRDPLGDDHKEVLAPFSGVVIGQLNLSLAHEGDALIHLAKVPDQNEAENTMNDFNSNLTEDDYSLER